MHAAARWCSLLAQAIENRKKIEAWLAENKPAK
jgi:hypothetical protein